MKVRFIAIFALALSLGYLVGVKEPQATAQARSSFTLECDRYDKAEQYLMCEQAKAARELADTVTRIEKKLPDFKTP